MDRHEGEGRPVGVCRREEWEEVGDTELRREKTKKAREHASVTRGKDTDCRVGKTIHVVEEDVGRMSKFSGKQSCAPYMAVLISEKCVSRDEEYAIRYLILSTHQHVPSRLPRPRK